MTRTIPRGMKIKPTLRKIGKALSPVMIGCQAGRRCCLNGVSIQRRRSRRETSSLSLPPGLLLFSPSERSSLDDFIVILPKISPRPERERERETEKKKMGEWKVNYLSDGDVKESMNRNICSIRNESRSPAFEHRCRSATNSSSGFYYSISKRRLNKTPVALCYLG